MRALVIWIQVLAATTQLTCFSKVLSLQNAIDQRKVLVKVISLGGHQGDCIEMEIKNITKENLTIEIEAGRRLNSVNDREQDILVVKEQRLQVMPGENKRTTLKGYCCQAEKLSPSKNSHYDVNKMADMPLYMIARYLNANTYDPEVEQKAVWAISNGKSAATITGKEDSIVKSLREMVATIKGEKLPWYTLHTISKTQTDGSILLQALDLRGEIMYSNEQESYVTMTVLNEKDQPVCLVRTEWLKACKDAKYPVRLNVRALPKGKYKVEMKSRGKSVATEEFEI